MDNAGRILNDLLNVAASIEDAKGDRIFYSKPHAQVIDRLRRDANISYAELARTSGESTRSISRFLKQNKGGSSVALNLVRGMQALIQADLEPKLNDRIGDTSGSKEVKWAYAGKDAQVEISNLARSLKSLLAHIQGNNELGGVESIIGPLEKSQLIALLEAALAELKAPYVDTERVNNIANWTGKIAKKAAEKEATEVTKSVFEGVSNAGFKLLEKLKDAIGSDVFPF